MDARHPKIHIVFIRFCLVAMLATGLAFGAAAQGLRGQLRGLAAGEDIEVTGLEKIGAAEDPRSVTLSDAPEDRLRALLAGYNFMIFRDSAGRVSALRILGKSRAGPPRVSEYSVPATRRGAHYLVDAVLIGPTGLWANRTLVVDTGASTVVLPESAIPSLGLRAADLVVGTVETAGGKVQARMGRLSAVRVGHAEVKNVPVTFIADEHLGRTALLGMSFLDHFRVTFDDYGQRIVLNAK